MRFEPSDPSSRCYPCAGVILGPSSASAYRLMDPPAPSAPGLWRPSSSTDVGVAEHAPEPCPQTPPLVGSALPKLSTNLEIEVSAYAKNPSSWDVDTWMDSGGPAGGGVPASAVRTLMRRGLAAGLTDVQVRSFLQPGFLRGMGAPAGGDGFFDFIGEQNDPALMLGAASFADALAGRQLSPMSAQTDLFEAFPVLRAAYMSLAHAVPPDLATAGDMLSSPTRATGRRRRRSRYSWPAGTTRQPARRTRVASRTCFSRRSTICSLRSYAGPLTPDAAPR